MIINIGLILIIIGIIILSCGIGGYYRFQIIQKKNNQIFLEELRAEIRILHELENRVNTLNHRMNVIDDWTESKIFEFESIK